jgi:hypothetical protein
LGHALTKRAALNGLGSTRRLTSENNNCFIRSQKQSVAGSAGKKLNAGGGLPLVLFELKRKGCVDLCRGSEFGGLQETGSGRYVLSGDAPCLRTAGEEVREHRDYGNSFQIFNFQCRDSFFRDVSVAGFSQEKIRFFGLVKQRALQKTPKDPNFQIGLNPKLKFTTK